jgi:hypothetical protein
MSDGLTGKAAQEMVDRLALEARIRTLEEALREIAMGRGPFKIDPMAHAESVIETMKEVARAALAHKDKT